jgi:hypothetical protein
MAAKKKSSARNKKPRIMRHKKLNVKTPKKSLKPAGKTKPVVVVERIHMPDAVGVIEIVETEVYEHSHTGPGDDDGEDRGF